MLNKISVIVLLLVLVFSLQVAADSSRIGVSVTIIEPTQELEVRKSVSFESEYAETNINEDQVVMEIDNAGTAVVNSNLPWEIYADVPELKGAEVYVRSNLDKDWVRVENNIPVLANKRLDRANLSWDIKVIADSGVVVKPFAVNFRVDWPKN